jgi:hypothetical protein
MSTKRKLNLNIKFHGDKVICAKSPVECKKCIYSRSCENMTLFYDPFEGINECMKSRSYKREKGAIRQR